jgi:hypothetical protein
MTIDLNAVLQHKAINQWRLFWLVSAPMSIVMIIEMMGIDLTDAAAVSHMISYSVRWAIPIIFLVTAISALQVLFPGPLPKWLLRNRKYIGMCFAVAMAWQGLFIFLMSTFFRDHYFAEIFYLRDELEGSTGYIFLTAMVVTSFRFGRKHLNAQQWKLLHKSGLYFLWAYPFSVYWWNLSYYENPQPIDHLFYWSGFLAFALRVAAWGKKRRQAACRGSPARGAPVMFRIFGGALIAFGLFVAATSLHWQKPVTDFLLAPAWSANLVLWLPYWPFEPYLSLFIMGLGTWLATKIRA